MALTLITGATGFIGSQVALRVLQAGYRARLAIRREEQADKLRRIFADYEKQLEFVVVPDITVSGCFDEALQGVEYVLHLASPLPKPGSGDLVTPARRGTVVILESAAKVPSIKKVVVTGSVLSLVSLGELKDGLVVRGKVPSKISPLSHNPKETNRKNRGQRNKLHPPPRFDNSNPPPNGPIPRQQTCGPQSHPPLPLHQLPGLRHNNPPPRLRLRP